MYGITIRDKKPPLSLLALRPLTKENADRVKDALDAKFKDKTAKGVLWCLLVVQSFNKVLYALIKLMGDVKYSIQTVFVRDENCRKIAPVNSNRKPDIMLVGHWLSNFVPRPTVKHGRSTRPLSN